MVSILFALLYTIQVTKMCTAGQRVSLTITGTGPSFFHLVHWSIRYQVFLSFALFLSQSLTHGPFCLVEIDRAELVLLIVDEGFRYLLGFVETFVQRDIVSVFPDEILERRRTTAYFQLQLFLNHLMGGQNSDCKIRRSVH